MFTLLDAMTTDEMKLGLAGFSLVWLVFYVIGLWKIFEKTGEKGWKALIPVYNWYLLFQLVWSKKAFWATLTFATLFVISEGMLQSIVDVWAELLLIPCLVWGIATAICDLRLSLHLSKSFGYGNWFGLGLWVLDSLFMLFLGLGKADYNKKNLCENAQ